LGLANYCLENKIHVPGAVHPLERKPYQWLIQTSLDITENIDYSPVELVMGRTLMPLSTLQKTFERGHPT
jgi:hypothetical protein